MHHSRNSRGLQISITHVPCHCSENCDRATYFLHDSCPLQAKVQKSVVMQGHRLFCECAVAARRVRTRDPESAQSQPRECALAAPKVRTRSPESAHSQNGMHTDIKTRACRHITEVAFADTGRSTYTEWQMVNSKYIKGKQNRVFTSYFIANDALNNFFFVSLQSKVFGVIRH